MFDLPLPVRLGTITLFGYAVGCLNAGYYLVRTRHGADLRTMHSGNAGATNAGRVMGRRGFALVLALDAAKGALAAGIGWSLAGYTGAATGALSAIAGHIWPAQLQFRGGKGVATALGAFAVLEPTTLALTTALALGSFALTRRWSASGLAAICSSPLIGYLVGRPVVAVLPIGLAAAVILLAHRTDIHEVLTPTPADPSHRPPP
jgi:glycerol-3-phosphate acyltransferase PlsY